jgi:hypothetical protein
MFSENYNLFCQLARQISALDTGVHFGKQINLKKPVLLEIATLSM